MSGFGECVMRFESMGWLLLFFLSLVQPRLEVRPGMQPIALLS